MEKLITAEFDHWASRLLKEHNDKITALFRMYGISETPTPETLFLACIKFDEDFYDALSYIDLAGDSLLYATGDKKKKKKGIRDFVNKTADTVTGAATAAQVFKRASDITDDDKESKKKEKEKVEDDFYTLFGTKVKKIYVWMGAGFVVLVGAFLILRKGKI